MFLLGVQLKFDAQKGGACTYSSGSGSTYTTTATDSDDDSHRPVSYEYCITDAGVPLGIKKTFSDSAVDTDQGLLAASSHRQLQNSRIEMVVLDFSDFHAGEIDSKVFTPPTGCTCSMSQ